MRVLVADDHRLFRQGLISLMGTRPDLVQVIGEAESGQEAVRLTRELKPDLVLMDITMPPGSGLQAAAEIQRQVPGIKIVMLTASDLDEHFNQAIQLGVAGYLQKDLDAAELFNLIEGIERGEAALTRVMATRLLKNMALRSQNDPPEVETLTEREMEVLQVLARGASNPQIAAELNISVNTVKTHIRHILAKLDLENRIQAAAYAVEKRIAK
jgi:DNA-binding NarL/FixJ family response regulator